MVKLRWTTGAWFYNCSTQLKVQGAIIFVFNLNNQKKVTMAISDQLKL